MKKRWICLLAAFSLAVGVITAKPAPSEAASPLDLERKDCSLTVNPEDPAKTDEEKFGEDLKSSGVVVDVYKVADAVKIAGYDSYTYEFTGAYKGISFTGNPMEAEAREWERLSQEAAGIPLAADAANLQPVAQGVDITDAASHVVGSLETGLYLLIAHGKDLAVPEDYTDRGG